MNPLITRWGIFTLGNYLEMEAEYQLKYENGVFIPDVLPTNDNTEDDYIILCLGTKPVNYQYIIQADIKMDMHGSVMRMITMRQAWHYHTLVLGGSRIIKIIREQ